MNLKQTQKGVLSLTIAAHADLKFSDRPGIFKQLFISSTGSEMINHRIVQINYHVRRLDLKDKRQ